jgi:anti-anti-sigma factor
VDQRPEIDFACAREDRGGATVITVRGEVDGETVPDLHDCLADGDLGPDQVELDLSGVTYFGSQGIGFVLDVRTSCRERDVDLTIVQCPLVAKVFRLAGIEHLFLSPPTARPDQSAS